MGTAAFALSERISQAYIYQFAHKRKAERILAEIDKQAKDMFLRLIKQMSEREGVTEQLKTENQMEWVGRMNNIRSRAVEIVNAELIYS